MLILPHDQPEVLAYFDSVRQVLTPYSDIVAPVSEPDLHWTVQGAQSRDVAGRHVGTAALDRAAELLRQELSRIDPFDVIIGPTASSRSAVLTRILPADQQADDPTIRLRLAAQRALTGAGLVLHSSKGEPISHTTTAYGRVNTDTPELAARSDDLASALIHRARHQTIARIRQAALVMERQHPEADSYSFEVLRWLPLGST